MKWSCSLTIPMVPQPKRRVRAATSKGKIVTYKDQKTKSYERSMALFLKQFAPSEPLKGAVSVSIRFLHARPKRLQLKANKRTVTSAGRIWKHSRPDIDNLAKAVCDSLQVAGFFKDDGQISSLDAMDFYTENDKDSRIELFICELAG